jgi:hypothetical protein
MRRPLLLWILALGVLLSAGLDTASAMGKEEEGINPEDPKLIGEPVNEASRLEELLATEYNKRQTEHFFLETSYPMDSAKDYIRFCELQYAAFLKWAGLPANHKLWGQRAHVVVIANKGEWEALLRYQYRHLPPKELELRLKIGGTWNSQPPRVFSRSHEGSNPVSDKLGIYHSLNHLFLHGLSGSGGHGFIPWLYESFSFYWALKIFGATGGGCIAFDTAAKQDEHRAWNDPDDWIKLLKREVKKKNDEDFILFWHKNLTSIPKPTFVKAWSLIDYLLRDDDAKGDFLRFIKMLKNKNDQAKALKMVYNWTPDDLDKAWRKWIKKQRSRKLTKGKKKRKR